MEQVHSSDKWMCYDCSDKPQIFDSPVEYERHLLESSNHADSFTAAQLPLLVEDGKTPVVPNFEKCPICQWSERHADFEDNFGKQSNMGHSRAIKIDDHVAEHLHSFALQALPDLDDNDTDSLQLSIGSVENNLRLLKKDDVDIQYSLSDRKFAYEDLCERLQQMYDILRDPLPEDIATIMSHRHLGQHWIPSSRQMETIKVIQSIIHQCIEAVRRTSANEIQGLVSTTMCYFKELLSDIISDITRARWRRTLLLVKICVRLPRRLTHRRGRFQDVVDLFMRKYMRTTPLLARSHSNLVGILANELIDGRCVFCNAIVRFFEELDLDLKNGFFDFHPSLIGVRSSAKLGCPLCAVFLVAIDNRYKRSDYGRLDNPDWSNARWDSIHGYGIGVETVNSYLKWRYGDHKFFAERTSSDTIKFRVPETLSEKVKEDLLNSPRGGTQLWRTSRTRLSRVVRSLFTPRKFLVIFAEDEHGVKTLQLTSGTDFIETYEICCARST
ncbi:hypothetical protein DL98DRAFT_36068 [Cadophora sp. DSE1049]|nr:hypothetical protein DL98DRAFT_36068 [Cadophora sp. DSE1049]